MNIRYKISFSIIIFIFAILFILLLALNGTIATMAFTMPEGLYNAAPSNNTLISSAPWSGDGTYIGNNGEGLQFGTNAMQTRSITIGKGGTEGGSGDFDGTKARDFRSTGLSTFDISNTEIDALAGSNGASLVSNIKLNTVDDNYAAVAHALATTNFKVKISFTATVTNPTGNTISYDVFINFYPTGASGDKISGLNSTPVVANGSTDINDTNAITISTDYADLSNAILEIIVYIPENGRLKLSSPVTKVSLDLNSVNLSILSSSTIEVTGSNRSDRRIITGGDVVDLTTLYVKPGDHLTIITGAYINGKSDTRYKFPDKFPYIFNLQDLEGTEKFIGENLGTYYSYTDPSGIIYESSGIELTKVSEKYILYNELTSYQTEFIVGNNTMLSNYFTIRPKIPTGIDENGNHIYKYQKTQPYNIYIDSGTPGTPTISTSSAFGKAIQNGEWFTDNSQPLLEMTATGQTVVTDEYTFAFILPTYITSLDMTQFDFNELNTSFNNGASRVQVVASVETGEETVDIQRIFKYTKQSQSNFAERKALIFDRSGEYSLYLITVDDVGNYSITRTYSNVYVDSTYHDIGLTYSVGGAQIAQGKGSIRVYYIVGASEHDSNGNPIRDAKDIHAYSNLYNTAKGAKRGEFVTFMILMDRTAYTNYRLESYINYATDNVPITRPTLKSVNNDNERYLFMTYVMDEANVLEGCFVICSLLEKATINVSQTQFVYSGAPLNMNAYASVSTIAGQGQPTTILTGITATFKFYDLASATAKKTGNALTITLDGVDYPFDNVGALTPLVTYNLNDMSYYTVSAAEISTGQYDLKIVCLDESAVKQSVTNAGEYWYRAEITSQTGNPKYYASSENFLTINRASPNVIDLRAVELTYGDSLDIIQYTSKTSSGSLIDVNNGYIVFTDATTGAVLKQLYLTAANVYGEYIIRSIDFESDIYTNPGAGSMSFNVEFVPFNPQL
ncbi:MAG: hypothetical protein LBF68_04705, partial [Christensenellaceae bacterium]|nr:hypothetical protein [Christensenellaceae bacterium]